MRVHECADCERLWQEYTEATFHFVRLDGQMKMAALAQEPEVLPLQNNVKAAATRRDSALELFKRHNARHGAAMTAG